MIKPYYEENGITIYHGDCLEIMPSIETACAIVTDPPFAFTGGISNGRSAECSDQFFSYWWRSVCDGLTRICGPSGSGFVWCDWKTAGSIAAGFTPKKQTYDYWRLSQMLFHYRGMPGMGQPFRSSVDMIGYIRGPKHQNPPIPNTTHNLITSYWYYGKHDFHPSEKSTKVATMLIEWCSKQDDIIFDPFMGSGTTVVAAKQAGRRAIGIELEERFCEIAVKRLAQGVLDFA